MTDPEYTIVVPTVGRPGLEELLRPVLQATEASAPTEVIVVDDRPKNQVSDPLAVPDHPRVRTLRTGGGGPALARQAGWHSCTTPWVVFLDDDVRPPRNWPERLCADLRKHAPNVAGTQGRIVVPRPESRCPTDAERNTIALEDAGWITADLALRRSALERVGGVRHPFSPGLSGGHRLGPAIVGSGLRPASRRTRMRSPSAPGRPGREPGCATR